MNREAHRSFDAPGLACHVAGTNTLKEAFHEGKLRGGRKKGERRLDERGDILGNAPMAFIGGADVNELANYMAARELNKVYDVKYSTKLAVVDLTAQW